MKKPDSGGYPVFPFVDLVGAVRFELTTTGTPCRYATRLRYAPRLRILPLQLIQNRAQFAFDRGHVYAGAVRRPKLARC